MPELDPAFQCHLWAQNTFPKAVHGARRSWHKNKAGFAGSAHTARESCTAGTVLCCCDLCQPSLGAGQAVTGTRVPLGQFAELGIIQLMFWWFVAVQQTKDGGNEGRGGWDFRGIDLPEARGSSSF